MTIQSTKRSYRLELLETAKKNFELGVGYFQETVILKETARRLGLESQGEDSCQLLTAWHSLLAEGFMDPGCDLDNPALPFLHLTPKGMTEFKKKRGYPGF